PPGDRADVHLRGLPNRVGGRGGESRPAIEPDQGVGVEQQAHQRPSKSRRTVSGSGASKSGPTCHAPLPLPGTRWLRRSSIGTNRASGSPDFMMMISSPDAARSTSDESRVLAVYSDTASRTNRLGSMGLLMPASYSA